MKRQDRAQFEIIQEADGTHSWECFQSPSCSPSPTGTVTDAQDWDEIKIGQADRQVRELQVPTVEQKQRDLVTWAQCKKSLPGPCLWRGLGLKKKWHEHEDDIAALLEAQRPGNVITIWSEVDDVSGSSNRQPVMVLGLMGIPDSMGDDPCGEEDGMVNEFFAQQLGHHPWIRNLKAIPPGGFYIEYMAKYKRQYILGDLVGAPVFSYSFQIIGTMTPATFQAFGCDVKDGKTYYPITMTSPWGFVPESACEVFQEICGHLCGWLVGDGAKELLSRIGLAQIGTYQGEVKAVDEMPNQPKLQLPPGHDKPEFNQGHCFLAGDASETESADEGGHGQSWNHLNLSLVFLQISNVHVVHLSPHINFLDKKW